MDDYYAQRYPRQPYQSMQPQSDPPQKRRMSAAGYTNFNRADMYGDVFSGQMMDVNANQSQNAMGKQAMEPQSAISDGSANMGINMGTQNMMQFNGAPGVGRSASLDSYQFSHPGTPSGMMMPPGSIFRNPAAANAAAAVLAGSSNNSSLNMANQYMNSMGAYGSMMPPQGTNFGNNTAQNTQLNMGMSGQFMPQDMSMSLEYTDSALNAALNDPSSSFNVMSQDQLMQSMINNTTQRSFVATLSRDSTRSSQDPGGGGENHTPDSIAGRKTSNSSSLRQNSYPALDMSNTNQQNRHQSFVSQSSPKHTNIQSNPAYPPNMQTRQQQQAPPDAQQTNSQSLQQPAQQSQPQPQPKQHPGIRRQQSDPQRQQQAQGAQQQSQQQQQQYQQSQPQQQQQEQYQQPPSQQQNPRQDMTQFQSMSQQQSNRSYTMQMNNSESQSRQWQQPNQSQQKFTQNIPMPQPPRGAAYMNAYSSTGFDMMAILMRVATRRNPEINIGAVDLSCAFVVCDAQAHDFPIVYCSENFERLTGYTKHEILGRNCRFLQAPDGKVQAGVKRSYVDDDSVLYLKNMIALRKEAQVSLINYRKGGQPFMNLLTMVPIGYDSDELKFFVGFQVDLVEQPNSVTNKNPDGSYTVNYQRGLTMPRYIFSGNERQSTPMDAGQTISRDDVSTVLSTIGSGESELSRRIFDKVLLENTDDVVFVLSLKGLFLYLSPSCGKILEYESTELSGTALSSICHPSDIVPVTRELRDTASATSVNIVFRIRRKHNGYMWFEGSGSLHTEQGKGRKSIVMVGRERPVYTLSKVEILASGGINDNEVWTKLSTAGMFLFVSGTVRQLLDKQPEELVGTSIQALMRPDTRQDFMRILEIARTGKRASCKHDLMNRRGQVLQAFTTIYPGDATEGKKPTFIVAQTRLLKYSRSSSTSASRQTQSQLERAQNTSILGAGSPSSVPASQRGNLARSLSMTLTSPQRFMSTFEAATTFSGHQGLEIGRQDFALASEENLFDELKTTRSTSWQFELRQMEKRNRLLAEELQGLLAARKKRKRRKGSGNVEKDCANCHTRVTPEWRRGPSGNRDLCNSCGLRWAKQQGRISPRTTGSQRSVHSAKSDKGDTSPVQQRTNTMGGTEHDTSKDLLAETGESIHQAGGANDGHVSKSAKLDGPTSPTQPNFGGGGSSLPTKIEEREDEESS